MSTEARTYVSDIQVVYGTKGTVGPDGRMREINGLSGDINDGFGGSQVWLVPQYNVDSTKGIKDLDISILSTADTGRKNLADGAGPSFRYLMPTWDQFNYTSKFTMVALYRSTKQVTGIPDGWDGLTRDINDGRPQDPSKHVYLYIVWKITAPQ